VSVLSLGVYPAPLIEVMQPTLAELLAHIVEGKL
jgi:NADH:ubiquinone oxidoreductase subunit 4 (subunit M)